VKIFTFSSFSLETGLLNPQFPIGIIFTSKLVLAYSLASAKVFLQSTLCVNHHVLFIFSNATSNEEIMAIQSLGLLKKEFFETPSTFDGP